MKKVKSRYSFDLVKGKLQSVVTYVYISSKT
jgi:hypothetical protein